MKYWNDILKRMTEYRPGEQPQNIEDYIKLNTNENPCPPSKNVLNAIKEACDERLRLYPDPTSLSTREIFAKNCGLRAENIFVGNGSDEIFTLLFRGFINSDGLAAFPYPSYSLYYTLAEASGIDYERIYLNNKLDIDLNDFSKEKYNLVIVGNPNNPTGRGCNIDDIRNFLERYKGLLVVDEAYVDFYGETVIDLVKNFDNIIITRSFSKSYSLAGLRVGIAIAHKDIIMGLFKLKDSYNIDRLAEAGARAALLDERCFRQNIEIVRKNKTYLEKGLEELGFEITPSKANFLFVRHPQMLSKVIYERLKGKKILVRFFEGPVQSEYLRITIGTMMELKTLIGELHEILKEC